MASESESESEIVIASPVRQTPCVLREFLRGCEELELDGSGVVWMFVDDNDETESIDLLRDFMRGREGVVLPAPPRVEDYVRDTNTHRWSATLMDRVAAHKDRMLELVLEREAEAVFLVDSDLVLHPWTLRVLRDADVDIVSEVFWTRWFDDGPELPNVWVADNYALWHAARGETLTDAECERRSCAFLDRLQLPGLHPVGGLGACTLIRRAALCSGVRFEALPNLSWPGEDRHFCVRAAALGFELWADTHVPPLHLYRGSDVDRVESHRAGNNGLSHRWRVLQGVRVRAAEATHSDHGPAIRPNVVAPAEVQPDGTMVLDVEIDVEVAAGHWRAANEIVQVGVGSLSVPRKSKDVASRPRVLLSMVVRNEADRYLGRVLERVAPLVTDALIIDDASDDATAEVCAAGLHGIPHEIIRLERSLFSCEHELRQLQWNAATARQPEWILNLDADEMLEPRAIEALTRLLAMIDCEVLAFRLFDMWDENHYRDDELWTLHRRWSPLLARPISGPVQWKRTDQHCGRWPLEIGARRWTRSDLRVQHLGWARREDREAKHVRYMQLDPEAKFGSAAQYASILDPSPALVRWIDS